MSGPGSMTTEGRNSDTFFGTKSTTNNASDNRSRSPAGSDNSDLIRSPGAVLTDTVNFKFQSFSHPILYSMIEYQRHDMKYAKVPH